MSYGPFKATLVEVWPSAEQAVPPVAGSWSLWGSLGPPARSRFLHKLNSWPDSVRRIQQPTTHGNLEQTQALQVSPCRVTHVVFLKIPKSTNDKCMSKYSCTSGVFQPVLHWHCASFWYQYKPVYTCMLVFVGTRCSKPCRLYFLAMGSDRRRTWLSGDDQL